MTKFLRDSPLTSTKQWTIGDVVEFLENCQSPDLAKKSIFKNSSELNWQILLFPFAYQAWRWHQKLLKSLFMTIPKTFWA